MLRVIKQITSSYGKNGKYSESLALLRLYFLIELTEIILASIRVYVVDDQLDPLYQTHGLSFICYGVLSLLILVAFLVCKFIKEKFRSLILVVCSSLLGLVAFESITKVLSVSFLSYMQILYLLPLMCVMTNETTYKKCVKLGIEGCFCLYLLLRLTLVSYIEHKNYPFSLSVSFVIYICAVLMQYTIAFTNKSEEINIAIKKLEKVVTLLDTQLPPRNISHTSHWHHQN